MKILVIDDERAELEFLLQHPFIGGDGEDGTGGVASYVPPVESAPPPTEPTTTDPPEGTDPPLAEPKIKLPVSVKPPTKPRDGAGRFQGRISDLVSQREQARSEAAQLREENSRLKGGKRSAEGGTAAEKTGGGAATLNPEDFDSYGEYVQALAEKTWEEKEAAKNSKQANERYEAYKAEKQSEFEQHSAPIAAEFPGFWEAISDPNLPCTEAMADAVMELGELAPMTMLYLASHRDEAAKIAKMNPRSATIMIGRIAAKLDQEIKDGGGEAPPPAEGAEVPPPAPQVPIAPRPTVVPVPRGSTPANTATATPSDKDDVQTWLAKETARLRKIHPQGRFYGA